MEQRTEADAQVIVEKRGGAGIIRLNRPKAINSLTLPMVRDLFQALQRFEEDAGVSCVVLTGEGDRGFAPGAMSASFTISARRATRRCLISGGKNFRSTIASPASANPISR